MKQLIVSLMLIPSVPAFADTYNCTTTVYKDAKKLGVIEVEHDYWGSNVAILGSLEVSNKQNFLGNSIEEVYVIMDGAISGGWELKDQSFNGSFYVQTTQSNLFGTMEHHKSESISNFSFTGDKQFEGSGQNGYSVQGYCRLIKQAAGWHKPKVD